MDPAAAAAANAGAAALPPAEDKGPGILAALSVVTTIETAFCAARLYTRGRILGRLHLDDYLIVLSVLFGWAALACSAIGIHYGNGRHVALLTPAQQSGAIMWTTICFVPGILSFGVPKLAVVALLTRLLAPGRGHRLFMWALAGLTVLSLLICVPIQYARCTPSRSLWDFNVKPTSCYSAWVLIDFAIFAGSLSAFTDLYLAVYPATVLFQLQMNLRKKLALSAALGIGSIATIVAIYKMTRLPNLSQPDFTYDTADLVLWTAIEGATIIIAACIPVLQPFVDKVIVSGMFGSRSAILSAGAAHSGGTDPSGPDAGSAPRGGRAKRRAELDIELASQRGVQHRRRPVKDPNGLSFLDETRVGSEESILKAGPEGPAAGDGQGCGGGGRGRGRGRGDGGTGAGEAGCQPAVAEGPTEAGSGAEGSRVRAKDSTAGGIVRTQEVEVQYGKDEAGSVVAMKHGGRWNRAWEPAAPGRAL